MGDEAIITWTKKNAISNSNCIRCFLAISDSIQKKSDYYLKQYGLVPEFKAGLHGGITVTGELGYTRREIAFMGDVMNTTSRIEEACKTLHETLLISHSIATLLQTEGHYTFKEAGKVKLRGKENDMLLMTLDPSPRK